MAVRTSQIAGGSFGGASSTVTSSAAITFAPDQDIEATTVRAALLELDQEIANNAASISAQNNIPPVLVRFNSLRDQ